MHLTDHGWNLIMCWLLKLFYWDQLHWFKFLKLLLLFHLCLHMCLRLLLHHHYHHPRLFVWLHFFVTSTFKSICNTIYGLHYQSTFVLLWGLSLQGHTRDLILFLCVGSHAFTMGVCDCCSDFTVSNIVPCSNKNFCSTCCCDVPAIHSNSIARGRISILPFHLLLQSAFKVITLHLHSIFVQVLLFPKRIFTWLVLVCDSNKTACI